VLIVDVIGKQYSGGGLDWKIVNRGFNAERNPYTNVKRMERIFVRDLSDLSYGNALGIGVTDITTDRLAGKIDWEATRTNGLTSLGLATLRLPIHLPTDRACLEAIMQTVGKLDMAEVTVGRIRNTLDLGVLELSENLKAEIAKNPALEVLGAACEMEFDGDGNLASPLLQPLGAH
jgi:hypothetical protein